MDIYVQIKNKKGEIFKVANLGREEYLENFKAYIGKISDENEFPVFFKEFESRNYLEVKKIKQLMAEIIKIAGILEKEIDNYKELILKRTGLETDILNISSLKNLMMIGTARLEEITAQIDKAELESELRDISGEISKLNEKETLLDRQRTELESLFDIQTLFEILVESIKRSSGIYIKN